MGEKELPTTAPTIWPPIICNVESFPPTRAKFAKFPVSDPTLSIDGLKEATSIRPRAL